MKTVVCLVSALLSVAALASDFVLVEPASFPRGQGHGRYGGLTEKFPLAIAPQYYGDAETPFHYAFITKPFHVATTEVTVGEFRKFIEATGYVTDAEKSGKGIIGWSPSKYGENEKAPDWQEPRHDFLQKPEFTWKNPGFTQTDDHPVVGVSWNDAQAYCAWLSKKNGGAKYRLPTEAEWEMVARAGQGDQFFSWGEEARGLIHKHANIGNVELEKARPLAAQRHWLLDVENDPEDGHVFTAPVSSFTPNPWGIHDLSGNVFEWCQDYYNFNYYKKWEPKEGPNPVAVDPLNASEKDSDANEFRVIRGGSWYTGPLAARSSARGYYDAPEAASYIGFRVVREATAEEVANAENPYDGYVAALKTIDEAGGEFRPENGKASLSMRGSEVSAECIRAISKIAGLRRIRDVKTEEWTQESWDLLAGMDKLSQFVVVGEGLIDLDLSSLAKQPELRDLQLSANGIRDESLKQLSGLESLHRLNLSGHGFNLTDDGMRSFSKNKELQSISVFDSALTGEFLASYSENPYFMSLWVGGTGSNDEAKRGWTAAGSKALVKHHPKLQILSLPKQSMTDAAIAPLAGLPRLEQLNFQYSRNLTDAGVAKLLESLPTLRNLELSDTNCGVLCADVLPQLPGLQKLSIELPNYSDASLEQISRCRSLSDLSLKHPNTEEIAQVTAVGIAKLGRNPRLEKLELQSPIPLGADIAELSSSPSLKEVILPVESLTDEAVAVFGAIPSLEKVILRTRDEAAYAEWEAKIKAVNEVITVNRR